MYLLYLTECLLGYPTCKIIAIDLNKKNTFSAGPMFFIQEKEKETIQDILNIKTKF